MFVKMGCKKWTYGTQTGLRVYTPAIRSLQNILNYPSRNGQWDSLGDFLQYLQTGGVGAPYSRDVLIVRRKNGDPIEATLTVAKHGRTSQGYITAPQGTWLERFVNTHLNKDYDVEYLAEPEKDLLVVPYRLKSPVREKEGDERRIKQVVDRFCRQKHFGPPPDARKIGLYYELQEVENILTQGLLSKHRYPYLATQVASLKRRNISCDIDVLDRRHRFVKFVEVKSVTGAIGAPFPFTPKEFESRENCRTRGWPYEIVVYYHVGSKVLERLVLGIDNQIDFEPSGWWCTPSIQ